MGHPEVINSTPFELALLQLTDESGAPTLVPVVKASFDVAESGELMLSQPQMPVTLTGELWGEPGDSSYKFEPEIAFCKPATDVVLVAHAHAPRGGATQVEVSFGVGSLRKVLRVTGDRVWYKSISGIVATAPRPFQVLPLSYERAYGGWDRSDADERKHHCDVRNPIGRGYRAKGARFQEGSALPNVEDPHRLLHGYDAECKPAGVGFISPDWQPRAALAGTYDGAWQAARCPLLPLDFKRAFFNAASPGLTAAGRLRGDEPLFAQGVTPSGAVLRTQLPGIAAPTCQLKLRRRPAATLVTQLDTVILDAERQRLILLWRAQFLLPEGLQGVDAVSVECADAARFVAPRDRTGVVIAFPSRRAAS